MELAIVAVTKPCSKATTSRTHLQTGTVHTKKRSKERFFILSACLVALTLFLASS